MLNTASDMAAWFGAGRIDHGHLWMSARCRAAFRGHCALVRRLAGSRRSTVRHGTLVVQECVPSLAAQGWPVTEAGPLEVARVLEGQSKTARGLQRVPYGSQRETIHPRCRIGRPQCSQGSAPNRTAATLPATPTCMAMGQPGSTCLLQAPTVTHGSAEAHTAKPSHTAQHKG